MEEKELTKSNKIKIIVLTLLIFFIAISGITYAYFSIQIRGNEEASSMRLTTANLSLVYNDVQIVSGSNATPGWTQTKTLTVYNDGNQTVYYNIIWRDLYNEIINDELVISAICASFPSGSCNNIPETVIPIATPLAHNVNVRRGIEISPGVTHTYTLTVEFIETGSNQNYNQNKVFYGTLNISEGSVPATLSLQTDQGTTGLSTGDVVRASKNGMANQNFYVISANANETVLLAKYNLYVGRTCTSSSSCTQLDTADSNYGLQSSTVKGYVNSYPSIGVVPFSGSSDGNGYWHDSTNSAIKSKYGTYTNNANNIYDIAYTTAPNWSAAFKNDAGNANYSIAYYVEEYVNKLGMNGKGRLLTYEEEQMLESSNSSIVSNVGQFWLGSAINNYRLATVRNNGTYSFDDFNVFINKAVRQVIVVSTSDIQNS